MEGGAIAGETQTVHTGGGVVREHGRWPTGKEGCLLGGELRAGLGAYEGVDALVDPVQPPAAESSVDRR